jgi:hypothetical protein
MQYAFSEVLGLGVLAVQAIQKMRGGAQSQLMLGSDGKLWVVKFQNNPQHLRVLANELIATRLAEAVGLTVPASDVVEVTEWLVANSPGMTIELGRNQRERYQAGLQFGSQFVGGTMAGQVMDYLPEQQLEEVRNLGEFAGMLCLDKWAGNCNGRQAVFSRQGKERRYKATFIDQGFCFNAGTGWKSFEPWLSRIEAVEPGTLWEIAEAVPPEWYGGDLRVIERLMEQMLLRRGRIRELIVSFRESDRAPFPMWDKGRAIVVPRQFAEVSGPGKFLM